MKSVDPRLPIKRIRRRMWSQAKTFLLAFVPLILLFLSAHGYFYLHRQGDLVDSIRKSEQYAVSILADSLEEHLHEVIGDLHRIASFTTVQPMPKRPVPRTVNGLPPLPGSLSKGVKGTTGSA